MDLDLNLLRVFLAIARTGTFSAAAAEVKLPVSSVGRAMTRLEQQLGVLLVQRSPKGISLTDAGEDYARSCRQILSRVKIAGESIQDRRRSPHGTLRVMAPIATARSVLVPVLPKFLRLYPDLSIELKTYISDWEREAKESVDVFFKIREPRDSGRRCKNFPRTRRGIYASSQFVKSAGVPVTAEELTGFSCVGMEAWKLVRGREMITVSPSFRVTAEDPAIFQSLVLDGVGVGTLPVLMANQPEVRKQLVRLLPEWEPEPVAHCALYLGPSRLTPKVDVFLAFVEQYFGTKEDPRLRKLPFSQEYFAPHQATLR
jgi:DNA-binding transcriptional LysR family regulator